MSVTSVSGGTYQPVVGGIMSGFRVQRFRVRTCEVGARRRLDRPAASFAFMAAREGIDNVSTV
jgi:hypothetical protein